MSRPPKAPSASLRASQAAVAALAKLEDDLQMVNLINLGADLFEPACPRDGEPLVTAPDDLESSCATCGYRRRLHPRPTKIDIVGMGIDALMIRLRNSTKPTKPTPKKR